MNIKRVWRLFLNITFLQKIIAYWLLILFFYLFSDFIGLFFLIFVFSYLFLSLWLYLKEKIDLLLLKLNFWDKKLLYFKKLISVNFVIFSLYIAFIVILSFTISDIIPEITKELWNSWTYINDINNTIRWILASIDLQFWLQDKLWIDIIDEYTKLFSKEIDVTSRLSSIANNLKSAWFIIFQIVLALILSFIFIVDRSKMYSFLWWIKESNFSFFYREYKTILEKVTKSFWLIFKAQSMIALVNAVLTSIWLVLIWAFFDWFPLIYTLAIIVFICWFIPVFWTFISSVPILIIAFTSVWWMSAAIACLFLILIVHAIEAYYLNPKIVSSFMELPMSLTFVILIISEHYLWIIWLIVWISMFYLILDLLKDTNNLITKSKNVLKSQDEVIDDTKYQLKNSVRMSRKI